MEISNEIKAKFAMQYYGQKILVYEDVLRQHKVCLLKNGNIYRLNDGYLLLRSENQITDDEKLNIAYLLEMGTSDLVGEDEIDNDRWGSIKCADQFLNGEWVSIHSDKVYQYIRSIGVLTSFTYIENNKPITLSTDELLKLGWVKIKET